MARRNLVVSVAVLALIVTVLTSAAASGEAAAGQFFVSGFGGPTVPIGRFAKVIPDSDSDKDKAGLKTGYHLGGQAGVCLGSKWMVGASVTRNSMRLDVSDSSDVHPDSIDNDYVRSTGVSIWVRHFPMGTSEPISPFVHGGGTLGTLDQLLSFRENEPIDITRDVGFHPGLDVGGGVLARVGSRFRGNVSVLYRFLFSKGETAEFRVNDIRLPEEDQGVKSNSQWWEVRFGLGVLI